MKNSGCGPTNKGEAIVISNSFRNAVTTAIAGLATALLLASCGGGGAGGNPNQGGPISLSPSVGTIYAGVPSKFTLSGGRRPYAVTSSEPQVVAVPAIVDGFEFEVIPNNPGVVDTGLQPGELPRRSVTITARDTTGILVSSTVQVGQNFLTGYGLALTPTTCPVGTGANTTPPTACPGGDTAIQMAAAFNGSLYGNQQFQFQRISGSFQLKHPVTGVVADTITVNSDTTGTAIGIITVPQNVPTQLAVVRTIHLPTGVYADRVFVISGTPLPTPAAGLTLLPSTITFTGALSTQCGVGTADVLVFDGRPPYTAVSTSNIVRIEPESRVVTTTPGRFTISVASTQVCSDIPVVITDADGRRATLTVSTKPGTTTPPTPTPFSVSPGTMTLTCGANGAVSVVGGLGNYTANSNHPKVLALIFGNTVSITRTVGDGAVVFPTTATVSVTDGTSVGTVVVSVPGNCP